MVKRARVSAYVWNFALPENTSCKTQMDHELANIYVAHKCFEGDDSLLYKNYYDYLLENRICAYTLPTTRQATTPTSASSSIEQSPRGGVQPHRVEEGCRRRPRACRL